MVAPTVRLNSPQTTNLLNFELLKYPPWRSVARITRRRRFVIIDGEYFLSVCTATLEVLSGPLLPPKSTLGKSHSRIPQEAVFGFRTNFSVICRLPTGTWTEITASSHCVFWDLVCFSMRADPKRMGGTCTFRPLLDPC